MIVAVIRDDENQGREDLVCSSFNTREANVQVNIAQKRYLLTTCPDYMYESVQRSELLLREMFFIEMLRNRRHLDSGIQQGKAGMAI